MGDLKPLGSEKLQGMDKIRRIIELSNYKMPQNIQESKNSNIDKNSEYSVKLPNGFYYGIVKETRGYIIKNSIDSENWSYMNEITERKYYDSYSTALKRLNIIVSEINRVNNFEDEIPLLGEGTKKKQLLEKKFVLKTKKKIKSDTETPSSDLGLNMTSSDIPAPPAGGDVPAPPAGGDVPAPPAGEDVPAPPAGGDVPAPPAGGDMPEPTDMGGDMPEPTDMGGDMPEPTDMGGDMPELEDGSGEDELSVEEPYDFDTGTEDDTDESAVGPMGLKTIQKLTGRLSQKLRTFDKDKGMDSQDIKYVLNSIISAIDINKLDDDDREDIMDKLDNIDEYGEEDDLTNIDLSGEDDFDMGSEDLGVPEEPKINESVEKVLSKHFLFSEQEKKEIKEKNKKTFLKEKLKKIKVLEEIKKLSESNKQLIIASKLLSENKNIKFIGKSNLENLIFSLNNKQIKVNPFGKIL